MFPSGLYTDAEVIARLNYRAYEFAKLTGCLASTSNHTTSVASQRDYHLDDKAIDIKQVAFASGTGTLTVIPNGDPGETDLLLSNIYTAVDPPSIHTLELGDVNTISLIPPPSASSRVIHLIYTRRPAALPTPPNSTVLDLPADFTPFVKYGALADLFNKTGETYDPQRAQICESLFQLGVQIVKGWVSGDQL